MQRTLKQFLLCCAILCCCTGIARASLQDPDSLYSESTVAYDSLAEAPDTAFTDDEFAEESLPRREVIYNRQAPAEARWLEATSDDAYSYRTKSEYVERPQEPPKEDPAWLRALVAFFAFFTSTPGKIILWTLLVLIVGFIVYRIIVGSGGLFGKRDVKGETPAESGELSEEGLMELNWAARMLEARAAGNQREAVRYGYLHLLQQLQAQELIRFRPDKTNIAYYRELDERYRPQFRSLTRTYEFAWYGGFIPDAGGLETYFEALAQFLQTLPKR